MPGKIQQILGNLYSLRKEIEYGFKQVKNQLGAGWFSVDRLSQYWTMWEIVFSAYLLVGWQTLQFKSSATNSGIRANLSTKSYSSFTDNSPKISQHPKWEQADNWKSSLNNLRLIIQPLIFWYSAT